VLVARRIADNDQLVLGQDSQEEHDRIRQDLLNYRERDTWAMVKVLERLRELSDG
jgi:hypothetical protein